MRLFALSSILILGSVAASKRNYETHNFYVIEHDARHASLASVSAALGVEVVERAGELPNHYLVRAPSFSGELGSRSEQRDRVLDALARLRARSHLAARGDEEARAGDAVKYISRQTLRQRVKRAPIPQEPAEDARAVAQRLGITDPLFDKQWHLVNEEAPEHSMNVIPIWEMGYTGEGVITSFVDDGLDYTSEDLKDNFAAEFSYDFNDHESLPTPKLPEDTHGTRCAGQVAAGKNNACGLGIAYDSKVAAVRILSGPISDVDEAASLNYGFQNVSIYSCSWGPPDNGRVMEGPDFLIDKAVLNGINYGRGGKGSVFVFASGNGAASGDQCNFDGYTNSIYSVTVSAVDHKGLRPYYSEACTANMVAAYSSGSGKAITTTDKGSNKCASSHGGTSAAAPNAAGVFALALEARPDLTWRDIQHLCVENARVVSPDDDGWETVAGGRMYNSKFGYGALDGLRYVQAALDWKLVKPQARMQTRTVQIEDGMMNPMGSYSGGQFIEADGVTSSIGVKWDMLQDANFELLEHIVIRVWIDHTRRGDVQVELTSPGGITSVLAEPRRADNANTGFPGWDFMTVKHWGEEMIGDWTLKVSDQASAANNGSFLGWNMVFWGSVIDASKAVLYDVSHEDPVLPPHEEPQPLPPTTATNTKTYAKPTIFLTSEESGSSSTVAATPEPTDHDEEDIAEPAADDHEDSDHEVADALHSEQRKVVAGIVFIVALISSVGGVFIWRRRSNKSPYITLQEGRAMPMSDTGRSALAADGNDSDEEADERTGLRSGPYQHHQGFHSGFLDDDEEEAHEYPPSRSPGRVSPAYRDEAETQRPSET
ncbi:peptidase S8/S53 domain-containing protein [Roridomyces roridus]|uniref:Peptidase S8/S53 domain-containing protein n=1 Tax=Roridomyces roridus TaxID=1738132 RepID=A0AAD7BX30_9AGAR|nr:peptidase S8/S53 domain-containing protein [Roridomyces roridus]